MRYYKGYSVSFIIFAILFSSTACSPPGQQTEVTIEPTKVLAAATTKPTSTEQTAQKPEATIEPTTVSTPTETKPTTAEHTYSLDGSEWTYLLRIPNGLDVTQPAAVVIVIHGLGEKPQTMYKVGFSSVSDEHKFILVYPDLKRHSIDFIRAILADLSTKVNIDPNRIYATGFSLGGKLAYDLACEMSDTFAAIAPMSGTVHCETGQPENAISVIHMHGTGDWVVPPDGSKLSWPAAEEVIASWVEFNDCPSSPQEEKKDGITHTKYDPCKDGSAVELYMIDGMGHKPPTSELPAAQIIWDFFEAHPKP